MQASGTVIPQRTHFTGLSTLGYSNSPAVPIPNRIPTKERKVLQIDWDEYKHLTSLLTLLNLNGLIPYRCSTRVVC